MSIHIPKTWYAAMGAVIILSMLAAGCAGTQNTPPPVTTPATTAITTAATTAPTTVTTTIVTTPPVTTMAPTTTVTTTAVPTSPQLVTINIQNFAFTPDPVTVPAGTVVAWTNQDSAPHQVVNDATPLFMTGAIFQSATLQQGQTFTFTFTKQGTYAYHCGIHNFMKGTITVT